MSNWLLWVLFIYPWYANFPELDGWWWGEGERGAFWSKLMPVTTNNNQQRINKPLCGCMHANLEVSSLVSGGGVEWPEQHWELGYHVG